MSGVRSRWQMRLLLPLSLGVADGILSALTLASGAVLHGRGLDVWLAVRVGIVSLVTAVFTGCRRLSSRRRWHRGTAC
ncbi:hypothetical protein A4R44_06380 [Amycolatopsis sp. M39]|nr:hypothetical protein A4R44_06380 [Amycolatopsis sp. M39]